MRKIVAVITGDGKGKTTSAVGQALRYVGADKKVLFVQFFKKGDSSEITVLKKLGVKVLADPLAEIPVKLNDLSVMTRQIQILKSAVKLSKSFDAVFLDEFNLLAASKVIEELELKSMLDSIKKHADIFITGRNAPQWIIEYADTVSVIKNIKHHYDSGILAERGREY